MGQPHSAWGLFFISFPARPHSSQWQRADSIPAHAPFCLSVVAGQSQEACFALELGSEVEGVEVPLVKVTEVRERVPEGTQGQHLLVWQSGRLRAGREISQRHTDISREAAHFLKYENICFLNILPYQDCDCKSELSRMPLT